jgi:hypothetical protein
MNHSPIGKVRSSWWILLIAYLMGKRDGLKFEYLVSFY